MRFWDANILTFSHRMSADRREMHDFDKVKSAVNFTAYIKM